MKKSAILSGWSSVGVSVASVVDYCKLPTSSGQMGRDLSLGVLSSTALMLARCGLGIQRFASGLPLKRRSELAYGGGSKNYKLTPVCISYRYCTAGLEVASNRGVGETLYRVTVRRKFLKTIYQSHRDFQKLRVAAVFASALFNSGGYLRIVIQRVTTVRGNEYGRVIRVVHDEPTS